jgi:hypothetical protein
MGVRVPTQQDDRLPILRPFIPLLIMMIFAIVVLLLFLPSPAAGETGSRGEGYGVELTHIAPIETPEVNPMDGVEIVYEFSLKNTGNQNDTYQLEVDTPTGSGTYKNWIIEFQNGSDQRTQQLLAPTELPDNNLDNISADESVTVFLYVRVDPMEEEGIFEEITVRATSDGDNSQVVYLYFNLTVILPNIRLSDDPAFFYIDPDRGIEEDDTIDINLRVFNDGSASTGKFHVFFYNGKVDSENHRSGNFIAYETISNIPADSYMDIVVDWEDIEGGENDLFAHADKPIQSGVGITEDQSGTFLEDGLVLESRENDNTASIDDIYQDAIDLRPDLTITNVVHIRDHAQGKNIVIVTIANIGSAKAEVGSATVSLKIDGDSQKQLSTNIANPMLPEDIDANDEIEIIFKWDLKTGGNHTVKAIVDHPDDIDSINDRLTTYFTTEDPFPDDDEFISIPMMITIGVFILGSIVRYGTRFHGQKT